MLALVRSPISRISQNALKASAYLIQARPARPLPPRNVAPFSTTPARRAEEDPLSPSIIALSQSPLMQKLANNQEAMVAFRAFLKVIVDEGLSVPNKQPSPMELIKLAANPRIMQAAKKFHQECANAGIHITKENAFELLSGRPKDL